MWPDLSTHTCPKGNLFREDFTEGLRDERWTNTIRDQCWIFRWRLFRRVWGKGNNGVNPRLVSLVSDNVDGIVKTVLKLDGTGDLYNGPLANLGFKKNKAIYESTSEVKRVGSGLCTTQEFSSGRYEVKAKIDTTKPGHAPSIWTFHYEEHNPFINDATHSFLLNPDDHLYRPLARQVASDWWYSTLNSEMDMPEMGAMGKFDLLQFNHYRSEVEGTYFSRTSPVNLG